jgi:predicted nucleic acid-binding protein
MLLDTTFLIDLLEELAVGKGGPARTFFAAHRTSPFYVSLISLGELAAGEDEPELAREFMARFPTLRLHVGAAMEAAAIDRHLQDRGGRLGENDTWLAGIARYNRQPIVSRDLAFDRVPGLRRRSY